jgi:hypothetical protein
MVITCPHPVSRPNVPRFVACQTTHQLCTRCVQSRASDILFFDPRIPVTNPINFRPEVNLSNSNPDNQQMPGSDSGGTGQGISHNAEPARAPVRHAPIKIHPRCVQNQQRLIATLDRLCPEPESYAIEIRNNMYIIKTTGDLKQSTIVRDLLGRA